MKLFAFSLVALTLAHCAVGDELYKLKGEECDPTGMKNRCAYRLYCRAPEVNNNNGNGTCELIAQFDFLSKNESNCLLEGSACVNKDYWPLKCCRGQFCDQGTCRQLPNGTFMDVIKEPTCRGVHSSCGDCATCWDCCGDYQCIMTPHIKGKCRHSVAWSYSDDE